MPGRLSLSLVSLARPGRPPGSGGKLLFCVLTGYLCSKQAASHHTRNLEVETSNKHQKMSDFRRKKLLHVFNVFFDVNHSGTIEKKDFDMAVEKICKTRGWGKNDPKGEETREMLYKVWDDLQKRADTNQDGQVSHEEWVTMWDDYAKNPDKALDWQKRYMNFMFELEDSSGDGTIDEQEFKSLCTSYGLNPADSIEAFNKFTANKTVEVTREVFADLWKQFFSSEDPSAPGNYIFGKVAL